MTDVLDDLPARHSYRAQYPILVLVQVFWKPWTTRCMVTSGLSTCPCLVRSTREPPYHSCYIFCRVPSSHCAVPSKGKDAHVACDSQMTGFPRCNATADLLLGHRWTEWGWRICRFCRKQFSHEAPRWLLDLCTFTTCRRGNGQGERSPLVFLLASSPRNTQLARRSRSFY